ncbi:hypothetical protein Tco_0377412 [Tanacetum coccineum]
MLLGSKERIGTITSKSLVMTIGLDLPSRILEAQREAVKIENIKAEDISGMLKKLEARADGTLCLDNRSWLPCYGDMRSLIMHESHKASNSNHPGADKCTDGPEECYIGGQTIKLTPPHIIGKKMGEYKKVGFHHKLPKTAAGYDSIWVIVDRLTKSAHFLPMKETDSTEKIDEDVHEGDSSKTWIHGTQLNLSTAYQPSDRWSYDRTNSNMKDIAKTCEIDLSIMKFVLPLLVGGSGEAQLPYQKIIYDTTEKDSRLGIACKLHVIDQRGYAEQDA